MSLSPLLCVLVLCLALSLPAGLRADPLFTVTRVDVAADAADAVAAKEAAITEGQRIAARRLMQRLTPSAEHGRLPEPTDAQLEALADGLSVRREQTSGTRYLASIDFSFSPAGFRRLLTDAGLPVVAERASETAVFAATVGNFSPSLAEALARVDIAGLAPLRVMPLPPALTAERIAAAGSAEAVALLAAELGQQQALLVVLSGAGESATLRLAGQDAVGPVTLERRVAGAAPALEAARLVATTIEARWKLVRGGAAAAVAAAGPVEPISISAQFSSARDWQTMRASLLRLPGAANLSIGTLSARAATLTLEIAGGRQTLDARAAEVGLQVAPDGVVMLAPR